MLLFKVDRTRFFLIFILTFLHFNFGVCQSIEPNDFDWSESFDQTTNIEYVYNSSLIQSLPKSSMFFVLIRPREEKKYITRFNKNEQNIYEKYKIYYYKLNGQHHNYGLSEMVNSNGASHYALMNQPNIFYENENIDFVNFNYYVGTLESTSINPLDFRTRIQSSNLPTYINPDSGVEWYRDTDRNVDISFPDDKTIYTIDLATNSRVLNSYDKVQGDIFRKVKSLEFIPSISVEGYCYEQKIETIYDNYNFVVNNDIETGESNTFLTKQLHGVLRFETDEFEIEGANINIFDVVGRLVKSGTVINNSFVFSPPHSGVYVISINRNQEQFSQKLYLNQL